MATDDQKFHARFTRAQDEADTRIALIMSLLEMNPSMGEEIAKMFVDLSNGVRSLADLDDVEAKTLLTFASHGWTTEVHKLSERRFANPERIPND